MSKFIIPIISVIVGIIIPVVGMTITPTRDMMLKLAPQGVISELPSKVDENNVANATTLQEMQTILEAQQSKINEQEEKIKEFEKKTDVTTKENSQTGLASQKATACSEANRIQSEIKDNCSMMPYPGIDECIKSLKERKNNDDFGDKEYREKMSKRLEKVESLKPPYLKNSEICGVEAR